MKVSPVSTARFIVRLVMLCAAVFLSIGGPLPAALVEDMPPGLNHRLLPVLSPLVALSESLAQRTWYMSLYWLLPIGLIFLAAIWKGRIFCRWICPAGSVYSAAGFVGKKTRLSKLKIKIIPRPLAGVIFFAILFSSLAGFTFMLSLDPLSSFNRITARGNILAWIPGTIVPAMLILGLFQPMIWCGWLCPLGYFFDLAKRLRTSPRTTFRKERRAILAGAIIGIPAAAVSKKLLKNARLDNSLLPPGAKDIEHFSDTCTRCYACVSACPAGVINVSSASPDIFSSFLPQVKYKHEDMKKQGEDNFVSHRSYEMGKGVCIEDCNLCSQVCPVGAIGQLTVAQKMFTQIGRAKIRRKDCLAWGHGEVCAVCDEFCPYSAIKIVYAPDDEYQDIPLPVVDENLCRGCGYCKRACLAPVKGGAIDILPVKKQRLTKDYEAF